MWCAMSGKGRQHELTTRLRGHSLVKCHVSTCTVLVLVVTSSLVLDFLSFGFMHIANTGLLMCCPYTPLVGYSRPPSTVNDPSVTK